MCPIINSSFCFSNKALVFWLMLICCNLGAQNEVETILNLNRRADSLTRTDAHKAKKLADEALALSVQIKNDSLEYDSRFTGAIANYFIGNLNIALENFIRNKTLAQKLKDPVKIIESLNAIGNVYKDIDRYDMALQSYREASDLCFSSNNSGKYYVVESNIAIVLNHMKLYDSSNVHCYKILRAMEVHNKRNLDFEMSIYGIILSNYIDLGLNDSVEKYAPVVLKNLKETGNNLGYAGNLFNIGTSYYKQNNFKKAEAYFKEAYELKPDNLELYIDVKKGLADALYELGNYKEAALHYWECLKMKDSLSAMQTVDKLSEMEVKYETGKKEEQLKRLSAEKEVNELKVKQSRIWLGLFGGGTLLVIIVAGILYHQNKNRLRANKLLQEQNNEIIHQKKEITDSINYAKRIQLAILPPDKMVKRLLPTAFVLYKPKDVVSGDFYWMEEKNGKVMFAAVDCTGHGVPGAMMSVVGLNLLNQAVKEKGLTVPSEILQHLDTGVTDTLRQSGDDSIKDGMDLSLCTYDPESLMLQYAGAFNNLWIVRRNISSDYTLRTGQELFFEEHLLEIKADKFPIGSNLDGVADNYTNHTFRLQKGDCVYLYSDGFADQFGGPKGKKFKYNALKKLLVSIHQLSPEEQKQKLLQEFESWRGNLEQIDDVLVMGVCV